MGGLGVGAMAVSLFLKPAAEGAKGGLGYGATWYGVQEVTAGRGTMVDWAVRSCGNGRRKCLASRVG